MTYGDFCAKITTTNNRSMMITNESLMTSRVDVNWRNQQMTLSDFDDKIQEFKMTRREAFTNNNNLKNSALFILWEHEKSTIKYLKNSLCFFKIQSNIYVLSD